MVHTGTHTTQGQDMANFDDAIGQTLQHEGFGTFTNDPVDPGGATRWGISLRFLQGRFSGLDIDGDGDLDADDVAKLSESQAVAIYRDAFWEPYRFDEIDSQVVANKAFDVTVNAGPRQAGLIVQRALLACGRQITVDGIIGPNTRAAMNAVESGRLIVGIRSEQAGFYRVLIARKPALSRFARGWERRAYA